jgi:hypothetical protein
MKARLLRGLVGGSIATAFFAAATVAVGHFSMIGTAVYGVAMACAFAVLPGSERSANRSAKPC